VKPGQPSNRARSDPELLASGCRQGALLEASARMLWLREPETSKDERGPWAIAEDCVDDAQLIVVSQDCDIAALAKTEPRVEAIAARWSSDASEAHTARKGNSARLYLLTESGDKALLADARRRVHIEKDALRSAKFTQIFTDDRARARFASWVAGRYDRPAIADELVSAVHKPVVKAVDSLLKSRADLLSVVDRIDELRFRATDPRPWTVDLIAMLDETDELTTEQEAEVSAWLEDTLVVAGGPVGEVRVAFRDPRSISLHDYLQTTRMPLDHYSMEAEAAAS